MAFEIVNETYYTDENQDPKRFGYIEGYTSNTVGETYLRLNVLQIPDQEMYNTYKRTDCLKHFEFAVGEKYGTGIRLSKKQVKQLIKELKKWLRKGY